jgi:serine/threonine protein kinase
MDKNKKGFSVEELLRLCVEVARGLLFLEGHKILHLDIKPENIYLGEQDEGGEEAQYHIGDFGLAVLGSDSDWEEGDGRYLAPELLNDNAKATNKADVYSFGAVLYQCATMRQVPRMEERTEEEMRKTLRESIASDTASASAPGGCLSDLILSMLSKAPEDRPSPDSIIQRCATLAHANACQVKLTPRLN